MHCRHGLFSRRLVRGLIVAGAGSTLALATTAAAEEFFLTPTIDPDNVWFFDDADHEDAPNERWQGAGSTPSGSTGYIDYSDLFLDEGRALRVGGGGGATRRVYSSGHPNDHGAYWDIPASFPEGGYVVQSRFYVPTPEELPDGVSDSDFTGSFELLNLPTVSGVSIRLKPDELLNSSEIGLLTWASAGGNQTAAVPRGQWNEFTFWHSLDVDGGGAMLFINNHIHRGWRGSDVSDDPSNYPGRVEIGAISHGGVVHVDDIRIGNAIGHRAVLRDNDFSSSAQTDDFVGFNRLSDTPYEAVENPVSIDDGQLTLLSSQTVVTAQKFDRMAMSDERVEMRFTIGAADGQEVGDPVTLRMGTFNLEEPVDDIVGQWLDMNDEARWQQVRDFADGSRNFHGTGDMNGGPLRVGDEVRLLTGRNMDDVHRGQGFTLLQNGTPTDIWFPVDQFDEFHFGFTQSDGLVLEDFAILGFGEALAEEILVGDMNWDGTVNTGDVAPFVLALTDEEAYLAQYPNITEQQMIEAGDINGDGFFNTGDVAPFVALLVESGNAASVPEPGSLALLGLGGLMLLRRRHAA